MAEGNFIDPDTWFARLPGVVVAAGALITDLAGQVLLVKPNYRDHWTLPGGVCEHGEPPHAGCAREVAEELGLPLPVGHLLAIDWSQPYGQHARPIMHFVFDGGTLDGGADIVLQREELDHFRFTDRAEMASYLAPYGVARVTAALAGRSSGTTVYQPAPISVNHGKLHLSGCDQRLPVGCLRGGEGQEGQTTASPH